MASIMVCPEKGRLGAEYEAAANGFAAAVTDLSRNMGVSAKAEYERLQRVADEARIKSEQGRLTLEQHVTAHCC